MHPIAIPQTSPDRYISFKHALNLRLPDEDTGEWHFLSAFFDEGEFTSSRSAPVAGAGGLVDTTPSLSDRGVREMSSILAAQEILPDDGPVYVANHYRAIADLSMLELKDCKVPTIANNRAINAWLDTEEQVNQLVTEYLIPLRSQLKKTNRQVFDQWIATVRYE
ncbi:hypothetical protein C1752_14785 [Acaryochloris thomasi RCC1774]|uniref:Uncharacterized protein n=1 Tax=Acaryochloris thomasi RCC1774 TaxID=1764569 RepID=A0A2W1J6V4_9CYAN|nr:hypothetical protein [Acaryochloris thomasi]PZD70280.1 hypothetical protein C1752_14785 [Acaryochloris thomasi RCC1774]